MAARGSAVAGEGGPLGSVLVVGGGIAGMQSALDLADSGFLVYIVESKPSIGGVMAQLDKTFPTNDCSMCIMAPKLVAAGRHPNIVLVTNSEVRKCEGGPGNFKVTITQHPRYIDPERCTGCGVCAQKCPMEAVDAFQEGTMRRAAAYVDYPQAVPLVFRIDRSRCIGCSVCEGECRAKAVRYDEREQELTLLVGAVILSPGFDEFDPSVLPQYGHRRYPNVVTSIEFERLLSATGPHRGLALRPSDGDIPGKVAFIQCVGSRDETIGAGFCSSVCCMYSLKEAVIAKEHCPGLAPHIFFMDVRAFGKEFEDYVRRARDEFGVRITRHARPPAIEEVAATRDLVLVYEEGGELRQEEFGMVVLAVGLHPPSSARQLGSVFGIELDRYGFAATGTFSPLETSRPGIFVAGAFSGPKDIPTTVAEASGAAAKVQALLATARGTLVAQTEFPPEVDVAGQEPRIGVFVCHCGINIGGVVDVPSVVVYARTLPGVAYAEDNLYTCSQDTQERIKQRIHEHALNRVIVASCTPRTHETLFQNTVREGGLNKYLFEMANIRDQCSWIHMHMPAQATVKAKDLVRMAVARARSLEPLETTRTPMTKAALVLGGGASGMTAALALADQGFRCFLVERERALGGNLARMRAVVTGEDPHTMLERLVSAVNHHPDIEVHVGAEVESIAGYVGNFRTVLRGRDAPLEHGVVIVATGGTELRPEGLYLYGQDDRVKTQLEFEQEIAEAGPTGPVVMVQCVGSRSEDRSYCSRVCCTNAVKNAIRVKEMDDSTPVTILYRDLRTYGLREDWYRKACELGVRFVRFDDDRPPVARATAKGIEVTVEDMTLAESLLFTAERLVLSAAILPQPDNAVVAQLLKVPLSKDGFFLEAHMKLRPVDFATEGVFLAGLAHWPKSIDESIAQACGAAARAATLLSKDWVEAEGIVSSVDPELCRGCGRCEEVCEYSAIAVEDAEELGPGVRVARVNEGLCKGCGACSVACPTRAVTMRHFTNEQIVAMLEALLQGGS